MAAIPAAAHKLMVWVDMRSSLTPGQKYVYWERAGINLRIEIGMKEVNAKMCKVVKSSKPEDYSSVVKVDSPLLGRALLKTLKKLSPVELNWLEVPTAPPSEEEDDDDLLINIQERIRISKLKETLITPGVAGEGSVAAELSSAGNKRTHVDGVDAPPTKRRKDAAVDASEANVDAHVDGDSSDSDSSDTDAGSDSDSSSHSKQQKPSRKHRRGSSGEDSDTTSSGEDSSDDDSVDSDDSDPAAEAENHEEDSSARPPAPGAVASDTSDSDGDDDDDGSGTETSQSVPLPNPQKQRMVSGDALSDDDGFDSDADDSRTQSKIAGDVQILPAPALPEESSSKRPVAKKSKTGRARGAVVRF